MEQGAAHRQKVGGKLGADLFVSSSGYLWVGGWGWIVPWSKKGAPSDRKKKAKQGERSQNESISRGQIRGGDEKYIQRRAGRPIAM